MSCVSPFATAPVWAIWPADREPVRLRYRQTRSALVESRPSVGRRVDCRAPSSPPPSVGVVRLTAAVDELVRRLAAKDEGGPDGVPTSRAATPHRQDHSCFRTDTKLNEIVRRLADGRDRSLRTRISEASRQQRHAFALSPRLFGGHSIGSSIDRSKGPVLLVFAPAALAPALPCRSIAEPRRALGPPIESHPGCIGLISIVILFGFNIVLLRDRFGTPASHFQRTYRCRAGVQRQLLRIRLSEAHPTARGSLRNHRVLVGITRNSETPALPTASAIKRRNKIGTAREGFSTTAVTDDC